MSGGSLRARDEPLDQHVHAHRIDFGDVQAVADDRIGRGAAPLTQDFLAARERDDVVDRQEVFFVLQLGDEHQFLVDLRDALRVEPVRPALDGARHDPLAEIARGRFARRHEFLRIFVLQLIEPEHAAGGHFQRFGERFRRIKCADPQARAQMPLCVRFERIAAFGKRPVQADRGQRVLQRLARTRVHQCAAGRHERQAARLRNEPRRREALVVAAVLPQFEREPRAAGGETGEPVRAMERLRERGRTLRDENQQAVGQMLQMRDVAAQIRRVRRCRGIREVLGRQPVAALALARAGKRDEFRQIAVARAVGRERDQGAKRLAVGIGEMQLAADDQLQRARLRHRFAGFLGRIGCRFRLRFQIPDRAVRTHGAGERAFVGDGERGVTVFQRGFGQFLRMRGAAQEREVAEAMQLGIVGHERRGRHCPRVGGLRLVRVVHRRQPKNPCRNQSPDKRSRYSQNMRPRSSAAM